MADYPLGTVLRMRPEAFMHQAPEDREVLVVEDSSGDGTLKVLNTWGYLTTYDSHAVEALVSEPTVESKLQAVLARLLDLEKRIADDRDKF